MMATETGRRFCPLPWLLSVELFAAGTVALYLAGFSEQLVLVPQGVLPVAPSVSQLVTEDRHAEILDVRDTLRATIQLPMFSRWPDIAVAGSCGRPSAGGAV